jgi:hypothetical protein
MLSGNPKKAVEYLWSDAWILLAIIYASAKKPASLSDIIAFADVIQHAIPTYEEMVGALARLTAGKYIIDRKRRFSPSKQTKLFYRSVTSPRRRVNKEEDDMERLLGASPYSASESPRDAAKGSTYPSLTRELLEETYQKYRSMFRFLKNK